MIAIGFIAYLIYKKKNPSAQQGLFNTVPVDSNALAGNYIGQVNTDQQLMQWVEECVELLVGMNVVIYPEVVNRCTNFSRNDLLRALNYYNNKYKSQYGTMYSLIEGEWDMNWDFSGGRYDPALAKFRSYGLQNY